MMDINFDNTYCKLPEHFYTSMRPTPVSAPDLISVNKDLCAILNIEESWLRSAEGINFVAGNFVPTNADPIATVYAGHQFGNWNSQLGDGRAILIGEVLGRQGERYDIQLKGSGPTPYSRGGDGRAPLGPILREYIVSEAMHALGVPTSRSLAAVATGDVVYRDQTHPGGILARVAQSHIRIGTFQYFAARQDNESVKALAWHVIKRHYTEAEHADNPVEAMFKLIMQREASLVANWQSLGFIHGVMNTDNILVSGETIDYGPCAFIDNFDPGKVFSSIDRGGRYAYQNQPGIMHWNLSIFAQCILPLLDDDQDKALCSAQDIIDGFPALYEQSYLARMGHKLGITNIRKGDSELIADLLTIMAEQASDFTLTFRYLAEQIDTQKKSESLLPGDSALGPAFAPWVKRWEARLHQENGELSEISHSMNKVNPAIIARNHLVEQVIIAAEHDQDFTPFHNLVDALSQPFVLNDANRKYVLPPQPDQVVANTFCGT